MDYSVNAHYWLPASLRKNTYPKQVTIQEQKWGTAQTPYFTDGKSSLRLLNSSGRLRGDQAVHSKIPSFAQGHLDSEGALWPVPFPPNHTLGKQGAVGSQPGMGGSIQETPQLSFPICWPAIWSPVSSLPISLGSAKALWQRCCTATTPPVCCAGTAK